MSSAIFKENLSLKDAYERLKKDQRHAEQMRKAAKVLDEHFPEVKARILDKADDAYNGYVLLPGSPKREFIGNPPLWHENPFHNKEYNYQLNRMNYWLPMLQAYYFTGKKAYLEKIVLEMQDWVKNVKPPYALDDERAAAYRGSAGKEWRILECGIRLYKTWGPCLEHLMGHGLLDYDTFSDVFDILYFQADMIDRLSDEIWPLADHNHYLMENLGLLKFAGIFPELETADKWKKKAARSLAKGMKAQVLESGAQIEGCPSYHNSCTFWFALGLRFGRLYDVDFPDWYAERLSSMGEWAMYMTRPDGNNIPWGDSGAIGSTLAKSAVCIYMGTGKREWMQYSAYLGQKKYLMTELGIMIWHMDSPEKFAKDFAEALNNPIKPPYPESTWNKEMKQVLLRNSWERDGSVCHFSCRSPVQNLHAHIDPCAFDYSLRGRVLAPDPGKYTYEDGEDRENFKSMRWHNTLMLNHKNAWDYISSWAYGPQKEGNILALKEDPDEGFVYSFGFHDNYTGKRHTRALLLFSDGALLIADRLENPEAGDVVSLSFNIDSEQIDCSGNAAVISQDGKKRAAVISSMPFKAAEAAKISLIRDKAEPSRLLSYEESIKHPVKNAFWASLFTPDIPAEGEEMTLELKPEGGDQVVLHLKKAEGGRKLLLDFKNYTIEGLK